MRKILYLFMVLTLVSCGSEKAANISTDTSKGTISTAGSMKISVQSIISEMEKGKYKEGELLVKFKSGIIATSSLKLHQAVGASVIKRFNVVPNLEHVKLPAGVSVKDAVIQYMADPNVEYAEPNYIRCASALPPSDTYFGNQWALNNEGTYAGGTKGADINALGAWGYTSGSPDIIVAVVDTGIDYKHQDLVGNIWMNPGEPNCFDVNNDNDGNILKGDCMGWNFVGDNNDPMDDDGHGTHVAGIIGAKGDNGLGIAGVMWNVKLMALKILGPNPTQTEGCIGGFVSDEIAAIDYALKKGAKVINASYHSAGYCKSEFDAIAAANTWQVLFIAAAGNGGDDLIGDNNDLLPVFPASYSDPKYGGLPNIISVAATDQNDRRASFSNFGLKSVHVAAPGVYVLSTVPQDGYFDKDFNFGTSMAAPHVSGLAGLLFSYYDGNQNTKFDYSMVRNTILRCVDKQETLDGWIQTGGRINAYKAVASLAGPTNLTATATSPNQVSLSWSANAACEAWHKVERKTSKGNWEVLGNTLPNSSSFIDSTVAPGAIYTYRVTAVNTIAESFPSNEKGITTPVANNSDGGGGCSIGARSNTTTAMADTVILLIPLLVIALMKRRR